MKLQRLLTPAVVVVALTSHACSSQASIVFDNGNHVTTVRVSSGSIRTADDFLIAAGATITDVHWKGGFYTTNPLPTDSFSISIYADNGSGVPGASLYTQAAGSLTRALSGESFSLGIPVYEYSAIIPAFVAAPGTTYWLSIFNNIMDQWAWAGDATGGNAAFQVNALAWTPTTETYTFQLTDDFAISGGVPEASTLAVWSILSGIGLFVGKRKLIG